MVKLLLREFKQQKSHKKHECSYCFMNIAKDVLYRKNSKDNTKLHEHCFKSLSIQSAKENLSEL